MPLQEIDREKETPSGDAVATVVGNALHSFSVSRSSEKQNLPYGGLRCALNPPYVYWRVTGGALALRSARPYSQAMSPPSQPRHLPAGEAAAGRLHQALRVARRSTSRRATSRRRSRSWSRACGRGERDQVLLGVTGSGKTFTMAKVIEAVQRPTLILAPNKTLAAQLYGEMKGFFPDNAVEYFVSYYDYYQPEAYVPRTDTYIEKDASDQRADRPHAPLGDAALLERNDVDHRRLGLLHLRHRLGRDLCADDAEAGDRRADRPRRAGCRRLVELQYTRNDAAFQRGTFRAARRHRRHLPGPLRGPGLARHAVRRRGRGDPRVRSADRREDGGAGRDHRLRQQPLRDAAADAAAGDPATSRRS